MRLLLLATLAEAAVYGRESRGVGVRGERARVSSLPLVNEVASRNQRDLTEVAQQPLRGVDYSHAGIRQAT